MLPQWLYYKVNMRLGVINRRMKIGKRPLTDKIVEEMRDLLAQLPEYKRKDWMEKMQFFIEF